MTQYELSNIDSLAPTDKLAGIAKSARQAYCDIILGINSTLGVPGYAWDIDTFGVHEKMCGPRPGGVKPSPSKNSPGQPSDIDRWAQCRGQVNIKIKVLWPGGRFNDPSQASGTVDLGNDFLPLAAFSVSGSSSSLVWSYNRFNDSNQFISTATSTISGKIDNDNNIIPAVFNGWIITPVGSLNCPTNIDPTKTLPNRPTFPPDVATRYYPVSPPGSNLPAVRLPHTIVPVPADRGVVVKVDNWLVNFGINGSINLRIDPTIKIAPTIDFSPNPPQLPDGGKYPGVDPWLEWLLQNIGAIADEARVCACKPDSRFSYTTITQPSAQSQVYVLDSNVWAVALQITQSQSNPRKESGVVAPDVLYAGWCEFLTSEGYAFERTPIDFQGKAYLAPNGARKFGYTCRNGYQASATIISRTEIQLPYPADPR